MNTQTETTSPNPMQVIEAAPLEDRSLPAKEVLTEQQAQAAGDDEPVRIFVP